MIRLCLTIAVSIGFAVGARAQDKSSHVPIREWGGNRTDPVRAMEMEKALRTQLGPGAAGSNPNVDPVLIKKLLETLQKSGPEGLQRLLGDDPELANQLRSMAPDDPELRRQLQDRARNNGQNPLDQQQLTEMMERFKNSPRPGDPMPVTPGGPTGDPMRPASPDGPRPIPGKSLPNINPPKPGDPPSPLDAARADRFKDFVKRIDRMMPASVKESDAMKRLGRKITDMDWSKISRTKIVPDSLKPKLDLERRMRGAGRLLDRSLSRMEGRRMPSVPNVRGPNLPNAPSLPSMGAPARAIGP